MDFFKSFRKQKPLSLNQQKKVIFSGSGDSLASAMLAESFSYGIVKCMDPLDLYKNKQLAKSRHVFFVSVSGNTIANIHVAKIAKRSTAITSKPQSMLARSSDDVILLESSNNDLLIAGSISFLESALTCISLVTRIQTPKNTELFLKAKTDAGKSCVSKRVFVLGNMFTYPLAMYCTAKFYEVLGYDAHYSRIEQFSHMELFSTKKGDTVIIFEEKNPHNMQLARNLKKIGLNVLHPNVKSKNRLSHVLYYVYFSQWLTLFEAKKRGQQDCHFILAKKLRGVSDNMIY